jgi:RNA polymerase primary sigma factor
MKAVKHFDPEKGYHFVSYAVWWIRQSILKAIGEKSRMVRLPIHKVQELLQIAKVREDLRDGRYHSRSEVEMIAQRLQSDYGCVAELLDISRELLSLDTPSFSDNESSPLGVFVKDGGGSHPDELLLKRSLRDDIKGVLSSLPQRESEILKCRFGLNDDAPMTLEALGSRYKVTKERIRQIEQRKHSTILSFLLAVVCLKPTWINKAYRPLEDNQRIVGPSMWQTKSSISNSTSRTMSELEWARS